MSDSSSFDEAFYRSRLRMVHLERVAYWRGRVSRADLTDTYDISHAQASSDFQRYMEVNPEALRYDLRKRRYFWVDGVAMVLQKPDFAVAVETLLPEGGKDSVVRRMDYPLRSPAPQVERAVMRALLMGEVLKVEYGSVHSSSLATRRLAPVALGHDGFRWHVRAWCFENGDYRDFVLTRIRKVRDIESERPDDLPPDEAWRRKILVRAKLNPELSDARKEILRQDFALKNDILSWETSAAMEIYARHHIESLASPGKRGKLVAWFLPQ